MKQIHPLVAAALLCALAPAQTAAAAAASPSPALPPELVAEIAARKAELAKQPVVTTMIAPPPPALRGGAISVLPSVAVSTAPGPVVVTARAMIENRNSSGRGGITISYTASGGPVAAGSSIRQTTVSRAVDDADRSLAQNTPPAPRSGPPPNVGIAAGRGGPGTAQVNGTLQLAMASRKSKSLKLIEGELEVFIPVEAAGSTVVVTDPKARAGKPIEELSRHGVEVIVLSPETLSANQPGQPNLPPLAPNFSTNLAFIVRDPQSKLAGYMVRGANGVPLTQGAGGTRTLGPTLADGFAIEFGIGGGPMPSDVQLVFYLLQPESLQKFPYRFENIPLP